MEYIRAEKFTSPALEINNIFKTTEEVPDSIDGFEIVADMTVYLAEYIIKCYYVLK